MGEIDDASTLFNHIMGDMKNMSPLLEDLLLKASKFYGAIKQTAITGDLFLDSFQKIADATTSSKGGTRDVGVAFTKIVMRHKAIEAKLKTYVGILADNFVSPLQESIDDWKRNSNQFEKDHTKDYKKLKNELKRANSDAVKIKKKASKKIGKQEYTDQYRDAMKLCNSLSKTMEDQEKSYLRKIMIDERERAAQLFSFYKPCILQELTLISEIEQLDSIVEETTKLCSDPQNLPTMSEDAISAYKIPDSLALGNRDATSGSSPPSSPVLVRDRSLNQSNIPSSQNNKGTISRGHTLPGYSSDKDPIAVSIPTPTWSSSTSDSVSARSSHSSLSSLEKNTVGSQQVLHDPITLQEVHMNSTNGHSSSGELNDQHHSDILAMHRALKTRTSWSSSETSDSSGIGSYHSLNSTQHHQHNSRYSRSTSQRSGSETDVIQVDYLDDYDERNMFPPPPVLPFDNHVYPQYQKSDVFHQHTNNSTNNHQYDMKYATIDRSHFKRHQATGFQNNFQNFNSKQRSNSLGENTEEDFPSFPDYKMNLPKSKMNTVSGAGTRTLPHQNHPNIFQVFEGHDPSKLLKTLNTTKSPYKKAPPPAPQRRNTSPGGPLTAPKPKNKHDNRGRANTNVLPRRNTVDNEPFHAKPGSFEASLQQQRMKIKQRSVSVDNSPSKLVQHFQDATKF